MVIKSWKLDEDLQEVFEACDRWIFYCEQDYKDRQILNPKEDIGEFIILAEYMIEFVEEKLTNHLIDYKKKSTKTKTTFTFQINNPDKFKEKVDVGIVINIDEKGNYKDYELINVSQELDWEYYQHLMTCEDE